MKCSLGIYNFLEEISSLSHSTVFVYFFALITEELITFLSLLAILWNSAFKWVYLSFSPLLFSSLLFTAICKASSDSHFTFLHFFFLGMGLIPVSCTMSWTSVHSSSGTLSMARLYWGSHYSRRGMKTSNSFPCSLPEVGQAGSLYRVRVTCVQVSGQRDGWGGLPSPRWYFVQGAWAVPCFCSWHPVFALGSSEMAIGFFVFLYLAIHTLFQLHMPAVIFSPL